MLQAWHLAAAGIHRQHVEVFGSDVMTYRQQVAKWCRAFASGRDVMINDYRSGRKSCSATLKNSARIEKHIQTDRAVTLRRMPSGLDLSYGIVWYMVVDALLHHMVGAKWVFRALNKGRQSNKYDDLCLLQRDTLEQKKKTIEPLLVM